MARTALLPKLPREGPQQSVPRPMTAPSRRIAIHGQLDPADLADPTLTLDISVQRSRDGGLTWQFLIGGPWRGGQLGRDGNFLPPWVRRGEAGSLNAGDMVRVDFNPSRRVRLGFEIETDEPEGGR